MRPLKFTPTIIEAYTFVLTNLRDFFAFAYLPVIALSIFATVVEMAFPIEIPSDLSQFTPQLLATIYARFLASLAFGLVMYVLFAVPWHRRLLIGSEGGTVGAALRWQPRHRRYLGRLFLMVLTWFVLVTVIATIVGTSAGTGASGTIALSPLMFWVGIMLTLVTLGQLLRGGVLLAAIAVDDPAATFAESRRLSKRCSLTLLALFFAATLPVMIAGILLINLLASVFGAELLLGSLPLRFVLTLIGEAISFVAVAVLTTVFSIAYRDLKAADTALT